MRGLAASDWKMRSVDRRGNTARALWVGCFNSRRRGARRLGDQRLAAVDWHHPQWLAVGMLILVLCCVDIVLTLVVVGAGGHEVNPVMRPLVSGSVASFIFWKFGLTSIGVILLILLVRVRLFGRRPAGPLLYMVLGGYVLLVGWEAWLLAGALHITEIAQLLPA